MKVLLTHGYFIAEDEKEQKIMRPYPPLGILYLSAWLERHAIENAVFDTTFSTKETFFEYLKTERPTLIGIYTNLVTKLNIIDIVRYVRKELPNTIIVIGGPDVTYNIENYLATGAQIAVIGEGEQSMLEIAQSIQHGNSIEFGHIDGIAYRSSDGTIVRTDARTRIRPVDNLPMPNRGKIDMQAYLDTWKQYHGQSAMTVSTQRGCPYSCKWCSTAVYGQSYRRRSPKVVVDELLHLKKHYNPDTVWFVDDVFTVSHKWLKEFRDEIIRRDAIIPFECITRADRMNEDVITWLKEAGAFRIWIGAESGSQRIIDAMDRRVEVGQVQRMIQQSKQQGIQAGTFIMLGYPGETEEDIKATVQHLKACNPDLFTITVAYPIKGTSLYNEVEAIQTTQLDWMESTDRDIDFQRNYSRQYYRFAQLWVTNEVRWYQYKVANNWKNGSAIKAKSMALLARSMMLLNRLV